MKTPYAHRSRPCVGETANGDAAVVIERDGSVLYGVIDGLGHGPKAHEATRVALDQLSQLPIARGPVFVLRSLHDAMRATRGAAMTVAVRRGNRLAAAGVGNVSLRLEGAALPFVATAGVLGSHVRRFRAAEADVETGRLLLHSDGISERFDMSTLARMSPERACEHLLAEHSRERDDATVLIADFDSAHCSSSS